MYLHFFMRKSKKVKRKIGLYFKKNNTVVPKQKSGHLRSWLTSEKSRDSVLKNRTVPAKPGLLVASVIGQLRTWLLHSQRKNLRHTLVRRLVGLQKLSGPGGEDENLAAN
jgi:hypothetical protein